MRFTFLLLLLLILQNSLTGQQLDHRLGQFIIQLPADIKPDYLLSRYQTFKGQTSRLQVLSAVPGIERTYVFKFDHNRIHEYFFLDLLRSDPNIHLAQFNHIVQARQTIPNDPEFDQLWHLVNDGSQGGKINADIDADLAWDIATGGQTISGQDIVIAVLDDGTELSHPDLIDNHWINEQEIPNNGFDDDGNGYIDDYNGWSIITNDDNVDNGDHGVNVTGIAAATGNNGIGITGVNWNVKVMTIKNNLVTDEAQVIAAYAYPLQMRRIYNQTNGRKGAFVVATNASWGFSNRMASEAPIWCAFYDTLGTQGILNIAATTNNDENVDIVGDLPTTCPSDFLISVTSADRNDQQTGGFGKTHIDLVAPGKNVYSTNQRGTYKFVNGTSFAAPAVTGIVGLLYATPCGTLPALAQNDPAAAALLCRQYLLDGVTPVTEFTDIVATGGRANAFKAVEQVQAQCGSCLPPLQLREDNIDRNDAQLFWISPDDQASFTLRWRIEGNATWTEENNVTSPFTLSGLQLCNNYQWQIKAICSSDESEFTPIRSFSTTGCCFQPTPISVDIQSTSQVIVNWTEVEAATSYDGRYRKQGSGGNWENFSSTDLNYTINDLEECTTYELQIRTQCDPRPADYSQSLAFVTLGCGACVDSLYCTMEGENSNAEWIESFTLNGITNTSGNNSGYQNFGDVGYVLEADKSFPFNLDIAYESTVFTDYVTIWIDYNQDGTFDDVGEVAYFSGGIQEETVGSIFIPDWVSDGLARMRIAMRFNAPADLCSNIPFGEVEDYCVLLKGGSGCAPPIAAFDTSIPDMTTINIMTTQSAVNTVEWQYRQKGKYNWSQPQALTEGINDVSNIFQACTDYEVRFKSNCDNNQSSGWEESFFVKIPGCTTCESSSYCESKSFSSAFEFIDYVEFNQLINRSGNDQGYGEYTNAPISTELVPGDSYAISIYPFFPLNPQDIIYGIWLDGNQDGDFDDADEALFISTISQDSLRTSLSIPATFELGETRLRIVLREENAPEDCGIYTYGETEDYCVTLVNQLTCTNTQFTSANPLSADQIEYQWSVDNEADFYELRIRPQGGSAWRSIPVNDSSYIVDQLDFCTVYEAEIQSVCGENTSNYAQSLLAKTLCLVFDSESPARTNEFSIYPNPTSDQFFIKQSHVNESFTLQIFTMNGQLIQQTILPPSENESVHQITAPSVPGIYFIQINGQYVQWNEKLIIH